MWRLLFEPQLRIKGESLFGWIAAQIPVQPHKCSTFGLRGVAVRMHWSTAADQPKSYESCLTVVTLIESCPRKRNSAKQALISRQPGVPRSIVVLLDRSALPMLEPSGAQPVKTSVQRY